MFFCIGGIPLTYYYLILGGTNNVLHTSVKYFLCTLWSLALAKKSCNNINNSRSQVSRLFYFLWLWFDKFVSRSVFGELQLTQISLKLKASSSNLKIWEQSCVWLFCYFNFERNYDVLKSKSWWILLNKNTNFNKKERESKIENPTHSFKEMNLVLQLISESQIKNKTVMSLSSQKNKENIFCTVCFVRRKFF